MYAFLGWPHSAVAVCMASPALGRVSKAYHHSSAGAALLNSFTEPDAVSLQEMRRDIAEQFVQRPWYTSGSTLQVSRLTAPRAVLLGDAAHAVSAAFGQGVNAALEVCAFLAPSGIESRDAALGSQHG